MGRYLLDTNIIIFLILGDADQIDKNVKFILEDKSNQFYTSAISSIELTQLYRKNKIRSKKHKTSFSMIKVIEDKLHIKIKPFTKQHIYTLSNLNVIKNHNDPFDHSIIAHAITEKLVLISSDHQFEKYKKQGLDFVFNDRKA